MVSQKNLERLSVLFFITALLFFYYGKIILSPNSYLSSDTGDGIMINTCVAGHVKNDTDYTNFRNMNYPYGQMHIFTGGQTLFAQAIKFFATFNPWFVTNSIGIINLMMLLSYVGCSFFLCLILQKFRLPALFVILGSVGITLLSPQVFRMQGHPELCYAVFFPLSWWLFIKFFESKKKILYSFWMIANSIFWFFVCPYYVMLSEVFYIACYGVILVQRKKYFSIHPSRIVAAVLQIALPLILTRMYIFFADTHEYRPQHPWGFSEYYAKMNSVFAAVRPPLEDFFQKIFQIEDRHWEGWAYIGFSSVIIALYSVFRMLRYMWRKKFSSILNPVLPLPLQISICASIPVLIFSMCLPFRLMPELFFENLGFLEQFRSLGRFAWIFYYVFTVYSVYIGYLLYRKLKMKKQNILASGWCIFLFSFFFIESYSYHKPNAESILRTKNPFSLKFLPEDYNEIIVHINKVKENYQCLVPLPFYHIGTDNFGKSYTELCIKSSMVISHWTNVPLLASCTARSPIYEAKKIMQFFSPPFFNKEIEKDLPNKKPFLVLFTKENLDPQEQYYFSRSRKIFENGVFVLSDLPYDSVFKSTASDELIHFNQIKNELKEKDGFLMEDTSQLLLYKSFDSLSREHVYRGKGALKGIKCEYNLLAKEIQLHLNPEKEYIFSYWFYNKEETSNQTDGIIEENNPNGNKEWNGFMHPIESMVIDGDWSLVEKKFRPKYKDGIISVFFKGDPYSKQELFADEFMVREAGSDLFKIVSFDEQRNVTRLLKNNVLINPLLKE